MDSDQKKGSYASTTRMAQLVAGAVSALSLSLGMAHAAVDAFDKPGTQPCATGEHCPASNQIKGESPASNQIKGETHDRKAGGNNVDSWSWGSSQGGGQHNAIGSATSGAGAGKVHDRKAGGNNSVGDDSHQLKLDSATGGGHTSVKTIAPPTPH